MLKALRDDLIPIIVVVDLLIVWSVLVLTGRPVPSTVEFLVTSIVTLYFGSKAAGGAVARALNGHSSDPPRS